MITHFSEKIVDLLIQNSESIMAKEHREVYIYGMECLLNTSITILFLTVWGILTHSITETLIWLVAFSILRHHTGGFHAPTQLTCILSSSLFGMSNYFVIKSLKFNSLQIHISYLFCMSICLLFAPIASSKIKLTEKMRKQKKWNSLVIILFGYIVSYLLPATLGFSLTYAFVCVVCLIFIEKLFKHFGKSNDK